MQWLRKVAGPAWNWFGHVSRLKTLLDWLGLYQTATAVVAFVGAVVTGWLLSAPTWQVVLVGGTLTVGTTWLVFRVWPPDQRTSEPTLKKADELWTFWRAHNYVMNEFGDSKDKRGRFPADAMMDQAHKNNLHMEGRRASLYAFDDDFGFNDGPHEKIPPEFWAQNALAVAGYLGGSEEVAQRTRTERRQVAHYDWSGPQYLDVLVRVSDLKRIKWKS